MVTQVRRWALGKVRVDKRALLGVLFGLLDYPATHRNCDRM
jgi:hypothetical protein